MRFIIKAFKKLFILWLFLLTASTVAQAGTWTEVDNMIDTRINFTMTLLQDGRLIIIGGTSDYTEALYYQRCEIYDPATDQWQSTYGTMIEPRANHTATLLPNNRILVTGGKSSSGSLDSVEIYDVDTDTWSPAAPLNNPRHSHTATRMLNTNQEILVVGGYVGTSVLNTFEVYDPINDTWTGGDMDHARADHTATLILNGQVLVCGGYDGSQNLTSCQLFTPGINTWTNISNLSTGRRLHTATLMPDNRVLVAGGNGGWQAAELFDLNNQSAGWTPINPGMSTSRIDHTAALLPDGSVLIAGCDGDEFSPSTSEIFDPISDTFGDVSQLVEAHWDSFAMSLLHSGKVLIAGGTSVGGSPSNVTELYHWAEATITPTGSMLASCPYHTATLLSDGRVLVVGGSVPGSGSTYERHSELYDPQSGNWTHTAEPPSGARSSHTATLLKNGRVLVTGGYSGEASLNSVELYNPGTNRWNATAWMNFARRNHTATLLADGRVLVVGGGGESGASTSSEIYDPDHNSWSRTGNTNEPRTRHTATLLRDGSVLVTGGYDILGIAAHYSEIYDPETGTWHYTGEPMNFSHAVHSAALLQNGRVLVMGGESSAAHNCGDHCSEWYDPEIDRWIIGPDTNLLHASVTGHPLLLLADGTVLTVKNSTEYYDPTINQWLQNQASMNYTYSYHTLTLLQDGRVLIAGGWNGSERRGCEIYDPGLGFDPSWRPNLTTVSNTAVLEYPVTVAGGGFYAKSEAGGGGTNNAAANHPVVQIRRLDNGQMEFLQQEEVDTFANSFNSLPLMNFPEGHALLTVFTNGIPSESLVTLVNKYPSVLSIDRLDANPTTAGAVRFSVVFDEGNLGVGTDDIVISQGGTLTNAAVTSISGGYNTYEVTLTGYQGEGTLGITIADNDTILDYSFTPLGGPGLGNGDFIGSNVYDVDTVSPSVNQIILADQNPTNATSVDFTVVFSEDVVGVGLTISY